MKQSLLEKISIYLLKKGYTIKSLTRTCFDVVARRETQILLIKVLEDANSISEEFANEMKRISSYIKATPLIVSEKAGNKLENGVVYLRFGVYTLNYNTLINCVDNKMPFIKRDHAGLTAHVLGERLKKKREEEGISLSALAKKVGVSRKMIQRYEKGEADVTVTKASKLYDIFGGGVFERINIFQSRKEAKYEPKSDIAKKYSDLGFEALETKKVPFDVLAKKEKDIVLTDIGDKTKPGFKPLSKLIDAESLVIFKKKRPKDIAAMTKEEFLEYEKAKELIKFLKEFEE